MENKTYLGDSVYAEVKENGLHLTTDNGLGPTNTIVLDDHTYTALTMWVEGWRDAKQKERTSG